MEPRRLSGRGPRPLRRLPHPEKFHGRRQVRRILAWIQFAGVVRPHITNDERTRLGRWSFDDIVQFLKTGHNRIGAAVGPMAEEVMHASSAMSDNDLKAIRLISKINLEVRTSLRLCLKAIRR